MAPLWWERSDLAYDSEGCLVFAGHTVRDLVHRSGTPAFFYSLARAQARLRTLHAALDGAGIARHRLLYAIKANRFMPLISGLAQSRLCGIDVCSPNEITHALACGFRESRVRALLREMASDGAIEKIGDNRCAYYVVKE